MQLVAADTAPVLAGPDRHPGTHGVDGPLVFVEHLEIEHPARRDLDADRTILADRNRAMHLLDPQRTGEAGGGPGEDGAVAPGDIGGRRRRLPWQELFAPSSPGRVRPRGAERLAARADDADRVVLRQRLDDSQIPALLANHRRRALEDVVREDHAGADRRRVAFRAGQIGQVGQVGAGFFADGPAGRRARSGRPRRATRDCRRCPSGTA